MAHSHVISLLQRIFPRASVRLLPAAPFLGHDHGYLVSYSDWEGTAEWVVRPEFSWRAVPRNDYGFDSATFLDSLSPMGHEFFDHRYIRHERGVPDGYPATEEGKSALSSALSIPGRADPRWFEDLDQRKSDILRRLEELTGPEPGRWSIYKTTFTWTLTAMALELEYDVEFKQLRRTRVNIGGSVYPVGAPLEEALADLRKLRDMALLIERTLNPAED